MSHRQLKRIMAFWRFEFYNCFFWKYRS